MSDLIAVADTAWSVRRFLHLNMLEICRSLDEPARPEFVELINALNERMPLSEDGKDWAEGEATTPWEYRAASKPGWPISGPCDDLVELRGLFSSLGGYVVERRRKASDWEPMSEVALANAIYVPCTQCEGDGCLGPNPAEDQCPRCGGSGCEPS